MDDGAFLALMLLLEVHTLDGRTVYLNPDQIVSVAPPKEGDALWPKETTCVISLTDRKFLSVKESCDAVQARLHPRE